MGEAASNVGNVALEVLHIDRIEADNSCVEAHVSFRYLVAVVVRTCMFGKVRFGFGEMLEEGMDAFFVGFLGSGRMLRLGLYEIESRG